MTLSSTFFILVILASLLSGFLIGSISARSGKVGATSTKLKAMREEAHEATQARNKKRKNRIIELAKKQGKITNDDVEDMFCISNSTAWRYLEELEKEGNLVQKGEGRTTHYTLS